jgi:hypothetical protein
LYLTIGRHAIIVLSLYSFCAAVYGQGAGFHSASNMFKNALRQVLRRNPNANVSELQQLVNWMRDEWEHLISHYMYAAAGIAISFIQAYIYRYTILPCGFQKKDWTIFSLAVLFYGLIIGSVAIEFPFGPIVALVLTLGYGILFLGIISYRLHGKSIFRIGKVPVLQYFILSHGIGLFIVIGWTAKFGFKNREDANIVF